MINYYQMFDYVSNSQLGALENRIYLREPMQGLQRIYDFGNLFDAMVTEPEKLDFDNFRMIDQNREVIFTVQEWQKAERMTEAVLSDFAFNTLLNMSKKQHVILRKAHEIIYEEFMFKLPMRMKSDLFVPKDMMIDLKSTACTSYKSFVQSLTFFDYDRQGAVYMDLGKVDRILYVGVSKEVDKKTRKPQVFKYLIERNTEMYQAGLRKYSKLGWKYFNYVWQFQKQNIILNI